MRLLARCSALAALLAAVHAGEPAGWQQAIDRGLAALARLQQPDGAIGEGPGITALAGMAFLAGGHTPTRGQYAEQCRRALRYVLQSQDRARGYLGGGYGNMYAHGFATLFLAECYGMAPAEPIRAALEAAVDLIHRSQNQEGGWRYQPLPIDADVSVTICQVMALRAAWNVGIGGQASVEATARAIAYVRRCATGTGSFTYTAAGGGWGTEGPEGVPRAAAGAMTLIGAGVPIAGDPHLGPALRFLRRHLAGHLQGGHYFWYGQYYAAQAMFHSPDREDWERYWALAAPAILARQQPDGSWPGLEGPGPAYGTAMALIILQIPLQYLPIVQR
ncbi:MAG: terpene cyclase/mutase family protein [Planctomycetota bacterium]|nr:terpene cyclase/mutase family protein [Planctomycetota bacterium]MCX8040638.1 terpene cyclase/mutase family protein [Planctomycetota bacterium]MDW8372366.1 terpene cyclase/mutase family protein [Planctomycetota bacterium]